MNVWATSAVMAGSDAPNGPGQPPSSAWPAAWNRIARSIAGAARFRKATRSPGAGFVVETVPPASGDPTLVSLFRIAAAIHRYAATKLVIAVSPQLADPAAANSGKPRSAGESVRSKCPAIVLSQRSNVPDRTRRLAIDDLNGDFGVRVLLASAPVHDLSFWTGCYHAAGNHRQPLAGVAINQFSRMLDQPVEITIMRLHEVASHHCPIIIPQHRPRQQTARAHVPSGSLAASGYALASSRAFLACSIICCCTLFGTFS